MDALSILVGISLCNAHITCVHNTAAAVASQTEVCSSQRAAMPNIRGLKDLGNASVEAVAERFAVEQGFSKAQTSELKAQLLTAAFAEAKKRKEEDTSRKKLLKTKAKNRSRKDAEKTGPSTFVQAMLHEFTLADLTDPGMYDQWQQQQGGGGKGRGGGYGTVKGESRRPLVQLPQSYKHSKDFYPAFLPAIREEAGTMIAQALQQDDDPSAAWPVEVVSIDALDTRLPNWHKLCLNYLVRHRQQSVDTDAHSISDSDL
eukprot:8968-Heterococcus_DN1.PRE.2